MLRSGTRLVFVYFHHCGCPFPFYAHNHVRVIATNVSVENTAVCIDKVMVMFQAKMLENLIHWPSFGTIKFGTLYGLEGTNLLMFASVLKLSVYKVCQQVNHTQIDHLKTLIKLPCKLLTRCTPFQHKYTEHWTVLWSFQQTWPARRPFSDDIFHIEASCRNIFDIPCDRWHIGEWVEKESVDNWHISTCLSDHPY